jgi:trans-aconitate 2-methyltransferase
MTEWNANLYLKFEDERTRPARDLLMQVPLSGVKYAVDLGCGPGNSTELLSARYPEADIIGVDSSEDMLAEARQRMPDLKFVAADVTEWRPQIAPSLIFANAVLQWVPDHERLFPRLVRLLSPGGALAVQMPDNLQEPSHVLMREVASQGPWRDKLATAGDSRVRIGSPGAYYDLLKPLARRVDIWHTVYQHALSGPQAIVEWVKGTGLRPFLAPLDADERREFLAIYEERLTAACPARVDGKVLLAFPRLFIVVQAQ